jgi:hypothetical protein
MLRDPPLQYGRAIALLQNSFNDIARPLAHLSIDAPHILAQQADAEKREADEQEHDAEQREQAFGFRTDEDASR